MKKNLHFLLATFPLQGCINPGLQFAKRLISLGADVTIATSITFCRRLEKSVPATPGLSFAAYSDAYDNEFKTDGIDHDRYLSEIKRHGTQTLRDVINSNANGERPITCVVYTPVLLWAVEVARELHVPFALLWIQPTIAFDIYYYYFNGYEDVIKSTAELVPWSSIELPGLPLKFTSRDLPSFLVPPSTHAFAIPAFKEQFDALEKEANPYILVNSFDALEGEAIRAIDHRYKLIAMGPLVDSEQKISSTTNNSDDYIEWMDSKPESSVIYVSFGSISVLEKKQAEEIGRALLDFGRPFLWVIRDHDDEGKEKLSCTVELEQLGKIVKWSSQVEVLSHPSLGCFLTHCGWNSTVESLVGGIPVVTFPQWADQCTSAKMIEDLWKSGVRVKKGDEEGGVVESGEILRCLDLVMGEGERGEEIRKNARKWKELAKDAVQDGGSSDLNLKAFVNKFREG